MIFGTSRSLQLNSSAIATYPIGVSVSYLYSRCESSVCKSLVRELLGYVLAVEGR